eukprot:5595677-Ditylum_brightwellii.AAC.1
MGNLINNGDVRLKEDGTRRHYKKCHIDIKCHRGQLFQAYCWTEHINTKTHLNDAVSEARKISAFPPVIDTVERARYAKNQLQL